MGITALYVFLCEALLRQGDPDVATKLLAEALAAAREEQMFAAELHRLRACAILDGGRPEACAEARSILEGALRTAQLQGARSLELRAASSLARLLADAGQRDEARDLLAPIYGWFTEEFDTADLKEAKSLIASLRSFGRSEIASSRRGLRRENVALLPWDAFGPSGTGHLRIAPTAPEPRPSRASRRPAAASSLSRAASPKTEPLHPPSLMLAA